MFAKISDLKAHLSHYLKRVRAGETVVIQDRSTPIARLVPIEANDFCVEEPRNSDIRGLRVPGVALESSVSAQEVLRADRDAR